MTRNTNTLIAAAVAGLFGLATFVVVPVADANDQRVDDRTAATDKDLRDRQTRAHFDRLDRDKDGRVTQAELDGDMKDFLDSDAGDYKIPLASLDTNSDGVIARDEWNSRYYDLHGSRYDNSFRSGSWDRNPPNR